MADTATSNYNWVKPEVGASNDTWGAKLNANFDSIDAKVKSLDFSGAAKTTPVDADRVALFDSAASNAAKYVTIANLKAAVDTPVTSASIIAALGYTPVNPTRQIIAGSGITGGGSLAADRTVSLGTPSTITNATTNSVTSTSHTHALTITSGDITGTLGYTPASNAISIVAGNGMTGGGTLAASRTITMGTPATITGSSTNVVSTTSHAHALTLTSADIIEFLGYTPVTTARSVIAGNGLSGGGTLGADRTVTLGTPGSITNSTTNSVTTTSHTHALGFTAAEVSSTTSNGTTSFPLGHTVIVGNSGGTTRNAEVDVRISASVPTLYTVGTGTALAGTWRARGSIPLSAGFAVVCERVA